MIEYDLNKIDSLVNDIEMFQVDLNSKNIEINNDIIENFDEINEINRTLKKRYSKPNNDLKRIKSINLNLETIEKNEDSQKHKDYKKEYEKKRKNIQDEFEFKNEFIDFMTNKNENINIVSMKNYNLKNFFKKETKIVQNNTSETSKNLSNLFEKIYIHFSSEMDNNMDYIRKDSIIMYFIKNPRLFKIYDIYPSEFVELIYCYKSDFWNKLFIVDFINCLEYQKNNIDPIKLNYIFENNQRILNNFTYSYLFNEDDLLELKDYFFEFLDKSNDIKDSKINFIKFIKNIFLDFNKKFNKVIYYLDPINKPITLIHLLMVKQFNILNKNQNKYLDWEELLNYIYNFEYKDKDFNICIKNLVKKKQDFYFEGYDQIIEVYKEWKLDSLSIKDHVLTEELVISIKNNTELNELMSFFVKRFGKNTIRFYELLDKIIEDGNKYINKEMITSYFYNNFEKNKVLKLRYNEVKTNLDKHVNYQTNNNKQNTDIKLYEVPKSKRKDYLRNKLDKEEFVKIYGKDHSLRVKNWKEYKITIPKNFDFNETKEKIKDKYIKELVDNYNNQRDNFEPKKFKPKKVPEHVKENLFEKLENYLVEKYNYRIYKKSKIKSVSPKKSFKAKEIPKFVYPGLLDELVFKRLREYEEKKQIIKEKKKNNPTPYYESLPERFKNYEIQKLQRIYELEKQSLSELNPEFTFKPNFNKIPDNFDFKSYFSKLQGNFKNECDIRKNMIKKERDFKFKKIIPFSFINKYNNVMAKDDINIGFSNNLNTYNIKKRKIIKVWRLPPKNKPIITRTVELRYNLNKERKIEQYNKTQIMKFNNKIRKEKSSIVRKQVIYSPFIIDNTKKLEKNKKNIIKNHQIKDNFLRDSYKNTLDKINERVMSKPLLLESATSK